MVLGSLLFLLLINGLPNKFSPHIRLHADDVIIYRSVHSTDDVLRLQEDHNVLSKCAQVHLTGTWHLIYNVSIWLFLTSTPLYILSTEVAAIIVKVSNVKHLGIILDCNLSWDDHIGAVTCKANGAHAFLQRYFKKCLASSFGLIYIAIQKAHSGVRISCVGLYNCQSTALKTI